MCAPQSARVTAALHHRSQGAFTVLEEPLLPHHELTMKTHTAERELLRAVVAWRDQPVKPDLRGLPVINVPALRQLRKVVPHDAGQRTLAAAYAASVRLSQPASVLDKAGADSLDELRTQPASQCDALARTVARQSGWLAGGSGAALGLAGAAGLVADAPALLMIALRALIRVGYCHGESPSPTLVAALFALASADTEDEKRMAWQAALIANPEAPVAAALHEAAIRDGLERAAEREFAKQALTASVQKLTTTLIQRLGVKKAAGALPIVGAAVGAAVNIRFVYLLTEAARMAFAARHLLATGVAMDELVGREALRVTASAAPATTPKRARKASSKPRSRRSSAP